MKDSRLEKEFEEYFKGVNISDDITADAKRYVKPRRNIMPKIAKFASIAASIVLVFAVALTIIFKSDFSKTSPDNGALGGSGSLDGTENPPSSGAPDLEGNSPSAGGPVVFEFYSDDDLTQKDISAYSLSSLSSSLKFIENFALADNASVESCKASYNMNDKLVLVKARVNISSGLNRDETTVFVEFTEDNLIYSELADYYNGTIYYYNGAEYFLTATVAENGEPEFKLHILYKGVKYYFNVHSSDKKAYEKYLKLIIK